MMNFDLSKILQIPNKNGLHTRVASKMASLAREAMSNVWVIKNNKKADASSVLDILMLDCPQGTEIKLEVDNSNDINILNKITNLIKNGFSE